MYLYRFEVVTKQKMFPVIIVATDDEQAFQQVENELEKYFLKPLLAEDITLHEKKRVGQGNGYVLYE